MQQDEFVYECLLALIDEIIQRKSEGEEMTLDSVFEAYARKDLADEGIINIMRSMAYNYITEHGDEFNESL